MRNSRNAINEQAERAVFVLTACAIVLIFWRLSPSWALMDDATNLGLASQWRESSRPFAAVWDRSLADIEDGRFRPVYFLWVFAVYSLFAGSPVGAYLATAGLNISGLLVWGFAFVALFVPSNESRRKVLYLLPLSFFIFPPYWNSFQYVSLQEKFVILFAGVAVLSFAKAPQSSAPWLWLAIGSAGILSGLLSKETMLAVPLAVVGLLLARAVLRGRISRQERGWLMICSAFVIGFSWFVVNVLLKGSYTARYAESLGGDAVFRLLRTVPRTVLVLSLLAVIALGSSVSQARPRRIAVANEAILPLALMAYIAVLLPWGYPTYLLTGMAPFVMGSLAIISRRLMRAVAPGQKLGASPAAAIAAMVAVMLVFDAVPKTRWHSDVREMKAFLADSRFETAVFAFPPPFSEHAGTLRAFTGRDVRYLGVNSLQSEKTEGALTHLITYLDHAPVSLVGVSVGDVIFANGTWKVRPVMASELSTTSEFRDVFPDASIPLGRKIRLFLG